MYDALTDRDTMPSSQLERATLDLVINRPRHVTYEYIEAHTGVTVAWLKNFGRGLIDDPPVKRVEAVFKLLSKEEITIYPNPK